MRDQFGISFLEASTWRGLVMFVSGVTGYELSETESEAIIAAGVAFSGLIGLLWKRVKPDHPRRKLRV